MVMYTTRRPCIACATASIVDRKYCHECNGLGYIDKTSTPDSCTQSQPECPVTYDPMVNGWECSKCGQSGPV